jgi:hypothetical protein
MIASRLLVEEKSYDPEVEMDISSCFGEILLPQATQKSNGQSG